MFQMIFMMFIALAVDAYHQYGPTVKAYFSGVGQKGNLYSYIRI